MIPACQLPNKILLCVSNTGGGHLSAAHALKSAINELLLAGQLGGVFFEVVIADAVEDSNAIHKSLVAFYNYLLRYRQSWMKYYYRLIELLKPDQTGIGYWLANGYVERLLRTIDPAIVVSVHPMTNYALARGLSVVKLPHHPKLIEVVLDPNSELWTGWACRGADLIVAPNNIARDRLIELHVDSSRIVTIGMPVDPVFLHPALQNREQFLRGLNLSPDLVTVCLTAGWAGGGNFVQIYRALASVRKPVQVIIVCGNNEQLHREIELEAQSMSFPTAVLRELPSLSNAMSACDLLVTKAGGLTTFEAVARRLPMAIDMITEPMPQESGTAEILIDAGLARPINHPSDIVGIVESLEHIDNRERLALPTKYNLDRTDAVYEIARLILSNCSQTS